MPTYHLETSPALDLALTHHRNDRGESMVIPPGNYQEQLYVLAWNRSVSLQAATQNGKTEWAIISQSALCELGGIKCMWVDPTEAERNKFQDDRIEHLKSIPYYSTRIGPANKSIWSWNAEREEYERTDTETDETETHVARGYGKSRIVWIGSNARGGFHGTPVDVGTVDEVDLCNQENLIMLPRRMDNSKYKIIRWIGNPTIPGFGINAKFLTGDQRHWHIPCSGGAGLSLPGQPTAPARHWTTPEWEKNVINPETDRPLDPEWEPGKNPRLICKCGAPIDRNAPGEWVPLSRGELSYLISKLFSTRTSLGELYERYLEALTDSTKMQIFKNQDLGQANMAEARQIVIPDEIISKTRKSQNQHPGPTVMGIDPGGRHHWLVLDLDLNLINAGWEHDEEGLKRRIKDFNSHLVVCDAQGDLTLVKNLREAFPAFHPTKLPWLFRCLYLGHMSRQESHEQEAWHTEQKIVQVARSDIYKVNRTIALDQAMSVILDTNLSLPLDAKSLAGGELFEHIQAPMRVWMPEKDGLGNGRYIWLKPPKGDHLLHCLWYAIMARRLLKAFRR